MVGILEQKERPIMFLKVVSINLLFLRKHITFANHVKKYQRTGNITHKNQMPLTNILVSEFFDVWGIDFIGPFPSCFGNLYIFLVIDYVFK